MKKISLLFMLVYTIVNIQAAEIRVQNPQEWYSYNGKISEMNVDVTPLGIYTQYDVYMTFTSQDANFSESEQIEIQYDFTLPIESLINDSWLWVEDVPIQAEIRDLWTATQIYESIVNRRQDPSLLKKNSRVNYSLQIYPMLGNGSRSVKISFILLNEWKSGRVYSTFPKSLVENLSYIPDTINITVHPSTNWQNPIVSNYLSNSGNTYKIQKDDYANFPLQISFSNPSDDNTFFSTFTIGNESYYQLIVSPFSEQITKNPKKILFVIDKCYNNDDYEILIDNLLTYSFQEIQNGSKINVIFDNNGIPSRLSSTWINTDDPYLLTNLFNSLKTSNFVNGNTLPLLQKAIELKNTNDVETQIILISNVESWYQNSSISNLINTLYETNDSVPKIDVISYQNYYYDYYDYYNNSNSYLEAIARRTLGNFTELYYNSELNRAIDLLYYNQNIFSEYDFSTDVENGFCYDQFNINGSDAGLISLEPIIQVGKFIGQLPFTAELSYIQADTVVEMQYVFDDTNSFISDSSLVKIWAGQKILSTEMNSNINNNDISEIVSTSIENRILSRYTAFLAIDPNILIDVDGDGIDDSIDEDISEGPVFATDIVFNNSSKVFTIKNSKDNITIQIQVPDDEKIETITLLDILSKEVESYTEGKIELNKLELQKGVYILLVKTNKNTYSLKVVI